MEWWGEDEAWEEGPKPTDLDLLSLPTTRPLIGRGIVGHRHCDGGDEHGPCGAHDGDLHETAVTEESGRQLIAAEWQHMAEILAQRKAGAGAHHAQWVSLMDETREACATAMGARTAEQGRQPCTPAAETHRRVLEDKAVRKAKNDDEVGPSRGSNDVDTLMRF
jgi:hypothetical protein